jgi:hypothetical protein
MTTKYDSYCHGLRFDKPIRLATDNVSGQVIQPEYNPVPPPSPGFFLLLNGGNFLLLNGQNLTLL